MPRLTLISDTHSLHRNIAPEPCDFLFFAGDFSLYSSEEELCDFLDWFCSQPAAARIMISGNHDRFQWKHPERFRELIGSYPLHYLVHELLVLNGLRIWGSPTTKPLLSDRSRRYELSEAERREVWERIPEDIDVLLTHTPPLGILDFAENMHCGCPALANRLKQISPKFHFFGHIHEDFGVHRQGETIFANAAQSLPDGKSLRCQPLMFDF